MWRFSKKLKKLPNIWGYSARKIVIWTFTKNTNLATLLFGIAKSRDLYSK